MIDLFKGEVTDDLPYILPIEYEQVDKFWDDWMLWRSLGKRNYNGGFEPSVSYLEAVHNIEGDKLQTFLALDSLYGKMERTYLKQKNKQKKGSSNG